MSFKSQREIFEHLLEGGKIAHKQWTDDTFFLFLDSEGKVVSNRGCAYYLQLKYPQEWQPYTEPKQKKKVTLYRYTFKSIHGNYFQSNWIQQPASEHSSSKLVSTESKEIEIEIDE